MSTQFDYLWDDLLPENGGFVGDANDNGEGDGIAMFHQLHCLQTIRMEIQQLLEPGGHVKSTSHHHEKRDGMEILDEVHWTHCFDYLRQACRKAHPINCKLG